jgi:hypothetical protein
VASSSGHAAIPPSSGNAPTMDTGLSEGDGSQEVGRLNNFAWGGNDNPTSPQPAPTARADQLVMPFLPGGSPGDVNFITCSTGLDPLSEKIDRDRSEGIWTPYGNPRFVFGGPGGGAIGSAGAGGGGDASSNGPAIADGGGAHRSGSPGGGGLTGPDGRRVGAKRYHPMESELAVRIGSAKGGQGVRALRVRLRYREVGHSNPTTARPCR